MDVAHPFEEGSKPLTEQERRKSQDCGKGREPTSGMYGTNKKSQRTLENSKELTAPCLEVPMLGLLGLQEFTPQRRAKLAAVMSVAMMAWCRCFKRQSLSEACLSMHLPVSPYSVRAC